MIIVRAATRSDLPELSHLWHEKMILQQQIDSRIVLMAGAPSKWEQAAALWLQDEQCSIRVAESDGTVLGYMIGWIQAAPPGLLPEKIGAVTDMMVDAHGAQGGVGRMLLDSLRKWFAGHGIQQIVAFAPSHFAVEQAFWRAQGGTDWTNIVWLL